MVRHGELHDLKTTTVTTKDVAKQGPFGDIHDAGTTSTETASFAGAIFIDGDTHTGHDVLTFSLTSQTEFHGSNLCSNHEGKLPAASSLVSSATAGDTITGTPNVLVVGSVGHAQFNESADVER